MALFLTVWWGNANEIEAAVMYPPKLRLEARRFLDMEVRAAVQLAGAS